MNLRVFTDGGAKGNPGPAAVGIVCYDSNKKELFRYRKDIGVATNNEAEYTAVVIALELLKKRLQEATGVDFYSDSLLMVKQLNGEYKVKKGHLQAFIFKIRVLQGELKIPISFNYIPREQNELADALVNDAV